MANGFDVILESLRNAKKSAIEQYAAFGKKHLILKYPLFVFIVSFIFISNFFLNIMIQMHSHKNFSKGLAYVLTAALVVSSISFTSLADDVETIPVKITAFSSLSSEVVEQNLYVGDEESKISFPTTLNVTIEKTEVVTTKQVKENEEKAEPAGEPKTDEINAEVLNPQSNTQEVQTGETTPELGIAPEVGTNTDGQDVPESPEGTTPESEGKPINELVPDSENNLESEPQQDEALQDPVDESIDNQDDGEPADAGEMPDDQARSILNAILPSITVYAANSSEIPEGENESETPTETPEGEVEYEIITETVTSSEEALIDGITWIIDAGNSSAEVFSSENVGAKFVYVPVISGCYDIAAELPRITVNIIAKEENFDGVNLAYNENVAGYSISIDATAGVFPEGTTVSINVVSNPVDLIVGEISNERSIQQIITFDISFWHDDVEIEPESGKVNVSISLADEMKETLQEDSAEVQVFHIDDDMGIEEIACSNNGEEVCFCTESFSEYSVVTSTGILDIEAPVILSLSLSNSNIEVPGEIEVIGEAEDDISGVSLFTLTFKNTTYGNTYNLSLHKTYRDNASGQDREYEDGKYHGKIIINQYGRPGQYTLKSAALTDVANNHRNYGATREAFPGSIANTVFLVNNAGSEASLVTSTSTDNIVEQINALDNDALILVDYSNNSNISSSVFDAIRGTEQTLVLESEGIQWVFDGSNITNESKNIDLSVNVQYVSQMPSGTDRASITGTVNDQPTVVLTFPENGTLPGNATMRVKADYAMRQYLGQSGIYVYYVDNATGRMVPVAENITITADNYIEFDIDHCSKYIVVKGALPSLNITPDNGSSGNGSASNGGGSSSNSSSESSGGSSDSSSASTTIKSSDWTPQTPDEKKCYAVVGKETITPFVDKSSGYTLTLNNAMQGPSCYAAFESVLNGYTIGRTYDILPNGKRVQTTDKEIGFSIEVPKALQKDGRVFQMICVTKGGQPIVLKDLDSNPNTVTIKTDKFYAFALVYKDTAKTE